MQLDNKAKNTIKLSFQTWRISVKSVCKSLMMGLLLSVATLIPSQVRAQSEAKPAIVISIANMDEQLKDVKYLLTASGFPELNFIAKAAIKGYAEGVDFSRSAGVALYFEGENTTPSVSGFIPVDDLEILLDSIAGIAEVEQGEDEVYTITVPDGTEIHVEEKGGYALFGTKAELLKSLPAEPAKMLGDNPKKYNLAFTIRPQHVPQPLRDLALDTIKEGSMQTLDQLDEDLQEAQRQNLKTQMRQFEMMLNDSESIMIGMAADADNKKLYTDVEFLAKAGSELAKKMEQTKATEPSRFTGFLMSNAAMNFNANGKIPESDGASYSTLLVEAKKAVIEKMNEEGELSDAEFEKVEELVEGVVDILDKTIKKGVVDAGMAAVLEGSDANFVGGMTVADPAKVEAAIKDLVPMLKERIGMLDNTDVPAIEFNLDAETHEGIRFHEINISIDDDDARDLIGDSASIVIGFGADSIYFGLGNGPMQLIKQGMAAKQKPEFDSEMNFRVAPFLKFLARAPDSPEQLGVFAEQLTENGGDVVRIYGKHIPNGSFSRFEMQGGILSLIKSAQEAYGNANDF